MINYDKDGRIAYTPELHFNQGKEWTEEDTQYLIDFYYIVGSEEMSLALGRTESSIAFKLQNLRKQGLIKGRKPRHSERLLKHYGNDNLIWRIYG